MPTQTNSEQRQFKLDGDVDGFSASGHRPKISVTGSKGHRIASRTAPHDNGDDRRRYFDTGKNLSVVTVFQGDYYVSNRPDEVLTTILGSCVSACVHDPVTGYGGMNHFLLPDSAPYPASNTMDFVSESMRYGSFAMEQLINEILARGGRRDRLEVKVFGGANVVGGLSGIGHRNADFIETFLANEGIAVAGKHLRGFSPRKIQFFPHSGRVRLRQLDPIENKSVFEKERRHSQSERVDGSIELFD